MRSRLVQKAHTMIPGYPAKPLRYRQDLRSECDPETEREAQPPPISVSHRRSQFESTDSGDYAASYGQYGQCGERHGFCHESHGFRKGWQTKESIFSYTDD